MEKAKTDVLMVAMGPSRTDSSAAPLLDAYKSIIDAVRGTSVSVFFVGGAGGLKVSADGPMLVDLPDFPDFVKNEANQHREAFDWLKTVDDVNWNYQCPPGSIQPGRRTKKNIAVGTEGLVVGREISAEDFAFAALDEVASGANQKQRTAVAYDKDGPAPAPYHS